jgi:hypothetical protein
MSEERRTGRLMATGEFLALPPDDQRGSVIAAIDQAIGDLELRAADPDEWTGYWIRMAIAALSTDKLLSAIEFVATARWPAVQRTTLRLVAPTHYRTDNLRSVFSLAKLNKRKIP